MPNGNPNFNLTEQDAWFERIAEPINDFVARNGLVLDKYYHDTPSWDLRFGHPLGGNGSIEVLNAKDHVRLSTFWYVDDYDSFTRFLHGRDPVDIGFDSGDLMKALSLELRGILDTPLGKWTTVVTGYEETWGAYSKREFESMGPTYPIPTLVADDT